MKAKETASRRTKNRLREHGQHNFVIEREEFTSPLFDGEPSILMQCECGWLGWIPRKEISE